MWKRSSAVWWCHVQFFCVPISSLLIIKWSTMFEICAQETHIVCNTHHTNQRTNLQLDQPNKLSPLQKLLTMMRARNKGQTVPAPLYILDPFSFITLHQAPDPRMEPDSQGARPGVVYSLNVQCKLSSIYQQFMFLSNISPLITKAKYLQLMLLCPGWIQMCCHDAGHWRPGCRL